MALTVEKFRKILSDDRSRLSKGEAPAGIDACFNCDVPLQESFTGNRTVKIKGKTERFCSDCYFEQMGKEIDDYPIYMPRVRRG